jgi:hypothetical protein
MIVLRVLSHVDTEKKNEVEGQVAFKAQMVHP